MKRIYNVLFPIWLFFLIPTYAWLLIIPGNFIIDSFVLYIGCKNTNLEFKAIWKQNILRIFLVGFLSDIIGALLIFGIMFLCDYTFPDFNTILFPGTTIISIPGVVLAVILIYFVNKNLLIKKAKLAVVNAKIIATLLAIVTAPYLMLIPIYG